MMSELKKTVSQVIKVVEGAQKVCEEVIQGCAGASAARAELDAKTEKASILSKEASLKALGVTPLSQRLSDPTLVLAGLA